MKRAAILLLAGCTSGGSSATHFDLSSLSQPYNGAGLDAGPDASDGGGTAALASDHDTLAFGTVLVDTRSSLSFALSNTGDPSTITDLALGGSPAFVLGTEDCLGHSVDTTGCSVTVVFDPTAAGDVTGTLTITGSAGGGLVVALTGTGAQPGAIAFSPASQPFGSVLPDEVADFTFMLQASADTGGITTSLGGTDASFFSILADGCGAGLSAGGQCPVTVRFTASMTGDRTAVLTASDARGGTATANLTATGIAIPAGQHKLRVLVTAVEGATGSVSSSPAGISNCKGVCAATFDNNSTVKLIASPDSGFYLQAFGNNCAPDPTNPVACSLTLGADAVVNAAFTPPNHAFVSSYLYQIGDLTGIGGGHVPAGADAACALLVSPSPSPGRWVGWASESGAGNDALSRIFAQNLLASGWLRTDGKPFVNSTDDLVSGRIFYPLEYDEHGQPIAAPSTPNVLTGTDSLGNYASSFNCSNWTVTDGSDSTAAGDTSRTSGQWTADTDHLVHCNALFHLYCFETHYQAVVTVPPPPATARYVFETSGDYSSVNGLSPASTAGTADHLCAAEASGKLPGNYKALLSSGGVGAASRGFTLPAGVPVVRADGAVVVASGPDLLSKTTTRLLTGIDVHADGSYDMTGGNIFTGGADPTESSNVDCGGWISHIDTDFGDYGFSGSTTPKFFFNATFDCAGPLHLYCLQSD